MPANGQAKAGSRETWLDLMRAIRPDAPEPSRLLTRDEFLARLNELGLDVDEATLRFWEYRGVLPRSVRRWDPAAKAARAYYPHWLLPIVVLLRELQRDGRSLDEAAPLVRSAADLSIALAEGAGRLSEFGETIKAEAPATFGASYVAPGSLEDPDWVWFVALGPLFAEAKDAIAAHVRRYERLTGRRITRAELVVFDEDGGETLLAPVYFDRPATPVGIGGQGGTES